MLSLILVGLALLTSSHPAHAVGLPIHVFGVHQGVLPDLRALPDLKAVVKLESKFSMFDYGNCTGTFISDRLVVTAAHCMTHDADEPCFDHDGCSPRAQKVIAKQPRPEGYLYEIGETAEFFISDDQMDIAIVRFPKGTYKGRPADLRIWSPGLATELEEAAYTTYGFGMTEEGRDSDVLRSSPIPALELDEREFTSRDAFRVDHGDSGGPVMAVIPGAARPVVVAVNHAYLPSDPKIQLFKPLRREFLDSLAEQGVSLPHAECACAEQTTFRRFAGERLLLRWNETRRETFTELLGLSALTPSCAAHETAPAIETYSSGDDTDHGVEVEVTKTAAGMKCSLKLVR